jgi:hypothetical protein
MVKPAAFCNQLVPMAIGYWLLAIGYWLFTLKITLD